MRVTFAALLMLALMFAAARPLVGQQPSQSAAPVFRSTVNLILVDVVVRDKKGVVVKGLTADDFELLEDGKKQQIVTFAFEEISNKAQPIESVSMLSGVAANAIPTAAGGAPAAPAAAPKPVEEA